jgi:hypothetical protein
MFAPCNSDRAAGRPGQRFLRNDLCAQLAPLNRYGLAGFSSALVDSLRALFAARRERDRVDCCTHC